VTSGTFPDAMAGSVDARGAASLPQGVMSWMLVASLCLCTSILYQVYADGFDEGALTGGGLQRFLLKAVSLVAFTFSIRPLLSVDAVGVNLVLKLPLLFVVGTIVIVSPSLTGSYLQALNICFFLPVLFIDWNIEGGARAYRFIWKTITGVVLVQLLLEPAFRLKFGVLWANGAVMGGMGNPNVFGAFLIASGLASWMLLGVRLRHLALVFFLATILTGSLVSFLVGFSGAALYLLSRLRRWPLRFLAYSGLILVPILSWVVASDLISGTGAIDHALGKLQALQNFSIQGAGSGPASLTARQQYLAEGLSMMAESPLSVLVGHPHFTAMYNGDGLWTSFLVSYGLPVTLLFLLANLVVVFRGFSVRSSDLFFSACVIVVMLVFFVTNRILDYWPTALIYLLPFSYLTNKGIRPAWRSVRQKDVCAG
jgi:hypothetical protein